MKLTTIKTLRTLLSQPEPSVYDTPEADLATQVLVEAIEDLKRKPDIDMKGKHWKTAFHAWRRDYESAHRLLFDPDYAEKLDTYCSMCGIDVSWLKKMVDKGLNL